MKKGIKWIAGVLAFVLLIAGAYFLYNMLGKSYSKKENITQESFDESSGTLKGPGDENFSDRGKEPDYDFTVINSAGDEVKPSQLRGKRVVINFWATWCHFCKKELPDLEKIYKKYGGDVEFMIINATDNVRETVEGAKSYIASKGYTFPLYFDTKSEALSAFKINAFPTTVLIDAEGRVVDRIVGAVDSGTLESKIKKLIK